MRLTPTIFALLATAAAVGSLTCGLPVSAQAPAAPTQSGAAKPPLEVFSAMRDGTKLAANVFLPDGPGSWPVGVLPLVYADQIGGR